MTRELTCEAKAEMYDHPRRSDNGFLEWIREFGTIRCGKPALFESILGYRCAECADKLRVSMRNSNTLVNVLSGRTRTEEEIQRLVRPLGN
jgi:hypothetical protein